MDRAVFDRMAAQEDVHWWFSARRTIIRTIIERLIELPEHPRLLEAGCGTGGNLDMLGEFGTLRAFELDDQARHAATTKSGFAVAKGALPGPLPFDSETFDLIGLFDVLEHVEQDEAALAALKTRLSTKGRILMTVPACPWLWSRHDEKHHHYRRYTRKSLRQTATAAGLLVEHSFYLNTALFPVAVAARAAKAILKSDKAEDDLPPALVNSILRTIFACERHLVGRASMPIGLSLCAVLSATPE